jgi:uroporphyrinogen-III synthase
MRATVVVTASAGSFPGLVEALRAMPIAVAAAFTSPRSARAFAGRAAARNASVPPATALWAAGSGTAQALGDRLGPVRQPEEGAAGEQGAAAALASALLAAGVRGPVLFPCGDIRRDELPDRLRDGGIPVEEVVCYRSVLADEPAARHAAERAQVLIVASPSVAGLLARACPPGVRPALLAVGPTTASAARASGWPPAGVAARPTAEALAAAVRALIPSR